MQEAARCCLSSRHPRLYESDFYSIRVCISQNLSACSAYERCPTTHQPLMANITIMYYLRYLVTHPFCIVARP